MPHYAAAAAAFKAKDSGTSCTVLPFIADVGSEAEAIGLAYQVAVKLMPTEEGFFGHCGCAGLCGEAAILKTVDQAKAVPK